MNTREAMQSAQRVLFITGKERLSLVEIDECSMENNVLTVQVLGLGLYEMDKIFAFKDKLGRVSLDVVFEHIFLRSQTLEKDAKLTNCSWKLGRNLDFTLKLEFTLV